LRTHRNPTRVARARQENWLGGSALIDEKRPRDLARCASLVPSLRQTVAKRTKTVSYPCRRSLSVTLSNLINPCLSSSSHVVPVVNLHHRCPCPCSTEKGPHFEFTSRFASVALHKRRRENERGLSKSRAGAGWKRFGRRLTPAPSRKLALAGLSASARKAVRCSADDVTDR
jgi:hypothetical protein